MIHAVFMYYKSTKLNLLDVFNPQAEISVAKENFYISSKKEIFYNFQISKACKCKMTTKKASLVLRNVVKKMPLYKCIQK